MTSSPAITFAKLPQEDRAAFYQSLSVKEAETLLWDWKFWARPEQLAPPGNWSVWMAMAGRGFGKTRLGAEWVRQGMCGTSPLGRGKWGRIALVAETAADARDVITEGPSGILATHPPEFRPKYQSSIRRLTWPNGAIATLYSAEDPEQLRGPEHEAAWCDEVAKWRYAQETWDMLQFGLRLGDSPVALVTTTPRPINVVRELIQEEKTGNVVITRGSTYDNAGNLASKFLATIRRKYEGTRLGRQELHAEVLDDVPGALWTRQVLEDARIRIDPRTGAFPVIPKMLRIVVAVDPSGSDGEDDSADEIGIVVAGLGEDQIGYILEDASCSDGPSGWAKQAIRMYKKYSADLIIAETNFGGAMVEATIRSVDRRVNYKTVTASRGKAVRAEPVAALYEQGNVRHVGAFPELEDQLCSFANASNGGYMGKGSPDRADAGVWALTELMLADEDGMGMLNWAKDQKSESLSAKALANKLANELVIMRVPEGGSSVYFFTDGHMYNKDINNCVLLPRKLMEEAKRRGLTLEEG